ncbi:hypothetical protein NEHOM01_2017 [Nematocida homosporus]|uniref:uncharacterized protein n=1 Tax=Nematocida homosporus TaxID=1912981 RepID=UPI00221EA666|nr:uncharacterized protein NEHOM01_2017 [Nematocida homosporus]KAI5187219.1 hypothetical protein NEHOM01_2017 [Nematocida homosporus]
MSPNGLFRVSPVKEDVDRNTVEFQQPLPSETDYKKTRSNRINFQNLRGLISKRRPSSGSHNQSKDLSWKSDSKKNSPPKVPLWIASFQWITNVVCLAGIITPVFCVYLIESFHFIFSINSLHYFSFAMWFIVICVASIISHVVYLFSTILKPQPQNKVNFVSIIILSAIIFVMICSFASISCIFQQEKADWLINRKSSFIGSGFFRHLFYLVWVAMLLSMLSRLVYYKYKKRQNRYAFRKRNLKNTVFIASSLCMLIAFVTLGFLFLDYISGVFSTEAILNSVFTI